jgi:hypothetical protein
MCYAAAVEHQQLRQRRSIDTNQTAGVTVITVLTLDSNTGGTKHSAATAAKLYLAMMACA